MSFPLRNEDVRDFSVDTTRGLSSRASLDAPNALEARIRALLDSSTATDRRSVARYERELRNHGVDAMDNLVHSDQRQQEQQEQQQEQQQQGEGSTSRDRRDRKEKGKKKKKRPLTPEEIEERRMGMRLYYQQLKNMRHNRIKSKSFRKLERLRKEELREMAREEREAADPDYAEEQAERQDIERARERATLKHSKATRALTKLRKKGIAGSNPEIKQMLADRARISRELKRKMDDVNTSVLGGGGGGGSNDDGDDPEAHQNFFTFDVPAMDQDDDASSGSGKTKRKGPRDDYDDTLATENAKEQVRAHRDEQQQKVAESLSAVPDADAPAFAGATARVDKKGLGLTVSGNVTVVGAQTVPQDTKEEDDDEDEAQNPWLAVPSASSKKAAAAAAPRNKRRSNDDDDDDGIDVDVAIAQKENDEDEDEEEKGTGEEEEEEEEEKESHTAPEGGAEEEGSEEEDENDADLVEHDETQARLVAEAFAADDSDLQAELDAEKVAEAEEQAGVEKDGGAPQQLPGWGQWAGEGVQESERARARREARERAEARARQAKIDEKIAVRRDAALRNVVINEKLDKKIIKYKLEHAPLGMSKEVYNRTVALPVGQEWQSARSFRERIEPAVRTQRGRVIEPMAEPVRITSCGTVAFADKRTKKRDDARAHDKPAAAPASISNSRKKPQKK